MPRPSRTSAGKHSGRAVQKPLLRKRFRLATKRNAIALGLAGALGFGGFAAERGIQAFRFSRWKRNTSLTLMLGTHLHASDITPLVNALEKARASGKPFDFIVLENASITPETRKDQERICNNYCLELRRLFGKELAQNNLSSAIKFLEQKRAFAGDPDVVSHANALLAQAARHGLRVKFGEEYSRRDMGRVSELGATFGQIQCLNNREHSTKQVLDSAANLIAVEKEYVQLRNKALARITLRAAAELRQESPELRGRELKGAVQVGLGHFGLVEEIKKQGIGGLKVDTILDFADQSLARVPKGERLVSSFLASDLVAELNVKGLQASPEQVALALLVSPVFEGALSHGDREQALLARACVFAQNQKSSSQILRQVWNLKGRERAAKILEMMTGVKAVLK